MYFSPRIFLILASALRIAIADDPDVPEFTCSSDAILVCCEEYTGLAIGQFVGNASACTLPQLDADESGPGSCETNYIAGCCRTVYSTVPTLFGACGKAEAAGDGGDD